MTAPPESFFERVREKDRDAARRFYKKYIDVKGMPVVASGEVADLALQRTYDIVTHMLAGRPDVLKAMVDRGMYLIIIGKDQVYTDMPEYRNSPQSRLTRTSGSAAPAACPPASARRTCSACPSTATTTRASACTSSATRSTARSARIDPTWRDRKNAAYRERARPRGSSRTPTPAPTPGEYWAEIAQAYFDCNRVNNWNHGPIGHREQLKIYDPEGYELVRTTFNLSPEQDWRYTLPPDAAQRDRAAGQVQDRSLLHQVHLGPRVHRARASRPATRPCSRPTTRSARCSPIATTSSRR